MMYVIQSTHAWTNPRTNKTVDLVSYFESGGRGPMSINMMCCGPERAKQFQFKTEAERAKRLHFRGQKGVKVVAYKKEEVAA